MANRSTNNSSFANSCPSAEVLAEFAFDQADDAVKAHLEACPKCQAAVEKEIRLSELIDSCCAPPADLAARIQAACRKEAAAVEAERLFDEVLPRQPLRNWGFTPLRIAAALVATALLSALLTASWFNNSAHQVSSAVPVMALALPEESAADAQPLYAANVATEPESGFSLLDSRRLAPKHEVHPQINNAIQTVSTDGDFSRRDQHITQLHRIDDEVTQVWLTGNRIPLQETINRLEKEHSGLFEQVTPADDLGIVTLRINGTDLDIQKVVDTLHERGKWTLLSPEYPQPGQANRIAFMNRPVKYTMKLIGDR